MIISDKYGFAFIHIPKSGGSTVRYALMNLDERKAVYFDRSRRDHDLLGSVDFAHLPLQALQQHFPRDFALLRSYRTFALIRDPMKRFTSSLHEYLLWNMGEDLAGLPDADVSRVIREVIEKLNFQDEDKPILDPTLIHFSRQSDFVELSGERIVIDLYPIERLDEMLNEIGNLVGKKISSRPINQRIQYRSEHLQTASEAIQWALRSIIPESIWRPMFNLARKAMIGTRLVKLDNEKPFQQTFGPEVEEFVRHFYRRDFEIYHELIQPGTARD